MNSSSSGQLHRTRCRPFRAHLNIFHVILLWMMNSIQNASTAVRTATNSSELTTDFPLPASPNNIQYSDEFLTCPLILLDNELYETYTNGSVYLLWSKKLYNVTDYLKNKDGQIYVCSSPLDPAGEKSTRFPKSAPIPVIRETANSSEIPKVTMEITTQESNGTEDDRLLEDGNSDFYSVTGNLSSTTLDETIYSDEFLTCPLILLDNGLYETYPNGSVYVPRSKKLYNVTDYLKNNDGQIYVCWSGLDLPEKSAPFPKPAPIRVIREIANSSEFTNVSMEITTQESNGTEDDRLLEDGNTDFDSVTGNLSSTTPDETIYTDEFLSCQHIAVDADSYVKYPNGSVFVPSYNMTYNVSEYISYEGNAIAVCSKILDQPGMRGRPEDKFALFLYRVTVIGTGISAFCLVLHIIMFLIFKKLRNLPGYSLFFLSIALLVAYTFTYISSIDDNREDCTAVGMIKAYAFLASFFWMNAMSYDIWRSLRMATNKLRLNGDSAMIRRLAKYSAYAWGAPFSILMIGLIVNGTDAEEKYKVIMAPTSCWFLYKQALLVYFALPIFVLIALNILLFVSSFVMISSATMNTAENKADLWARFLVALRLGVVMGLMWIFGLLSALTQSLWLAYLNVFCSVLQGVFIFFSFTFTEKMRKECRKALQRLLAIPIWIRHQAENIFK